MKATWPLATCTHTDKHTGAYWDNKRRLLFSSAGKNEEHTGPCFADVVAVAAAHVRQATLSAAKTDLDHTTTERIPTTPEQHVADAFADAERQTPFNICSCSLLVYKPRQAFPIVPVPKPIKTSQSPYYTMKTCEDATFIHRAPTHKMLSGK